MKRYILFLFTCTLSIALFAVPAYRGGIEVTQPDGTTLTIYQHGDEFFHYTTTADGKWVAQDEQGFYREVPALSETQIQQRRAQSDRRRLTEQTQKAYPLNLAPRGLVILVNFKDTKMREENTREAFENMLNGDNYTEYGAIASARQYFIEQSNGKYQPHFDVVGPVELPESASYYGKNNIGGKDENVAKMVLKACDLAHNMGVDFSEYDNNMDDEVDFIFFIYAGYGEADGGGANTIWPHMYWLRKGYGITYKLDDMYINTYACSSELNFDTKHRNGISTFCHEFGHVLGLPDMYSTASTSHRTLGRWDLMDYGTYNNFGNTPPAYSGYERFFLGWTQPFVLHEAATYTLPELQHSNSVGLISTTGTHNLQGNDPSPAQFYLLENRQQTRWDTYLPGHGMMLTRINYTYWSWLANDVNNDPTAMRIDILEADGKALDYADDRVNYYGKASDLFPAGAIEYQQITDYPLTNITEHDGLITFDFMGGGASVFLQDDTAVDNVAPSEETIIAIYNLLGQQQPTTAIQDLKSGVYILKTNKTTRKISIP